MPKLDYRVKLTRAPSEQEPNGYRNTVQKREETGADVEARKFAYSGATAEVWHVHPDTGARTHLRTYSPAGVSPTFDAHDSLGFYDDAAFLTDEQLAQGMTHQVAEVEVEEAPEPQEAPVPRFRFAVVNRSNPQNTPFFRTNDWDEALSYLERDPERWMIRSWTPPTAHNAQARLVGGAGSRSKTFRAKCDACGWQGPNRAQQSECQSKDVNPHNDLPWEGPMPEPTPEYPPFEPLLKSEREEKEATPLDVEGALRYLLGPGSSAVVHEGDRFHREPYVMLTAADMAKILDRLPESTW